MKTDYKPRTLTTSGGSTVVSIPPDLLEELGLSTGDTVLASRDNGGIIIEPVEVRYERLENE